MGSTTVQAAPERNYAQETKDTLATQIQLAPQLYASESQYQPLYNNLQMQMTRDALLGNASAPGLLQTYQQAVPMLGQISAASNTQQRSSDIADVAALGPQASAAFYAANPQLAAALQSAQGMAGQTNNAATNALNAAVANQQQFTPVSAGQVVAGNVATPASVAAGQLSAGTVSAGDSVSAQQIASPAAIQAQQVQSQAQNAALVGAPQQVQAQGIQGGALGQSLYSQALNAGLSPISQALQGSVMSNLTANGSLSQAELRAGEQQIRAAYAARGMAMSPQAIAAEAQNRLVNERERMLQNLQVAQSVNAQVQGEQNANRAFAGSVLGQDVSIQNQNAANSLNAQTTNAQLGLQSGLANQSSLNQVGLANQQSGLQAQLANQQAGLQAGQYNTNASLQAQQANQQAALQASLANQQSAYNTSLSNAQLGMQAGQQNQQANLSAALANQQAAYSANLANAQMGMQASQQNQQLGLQAQLANQQAGIQTYQNYLQNLGQTAQLNNQQTAADRGFAAQLAGLYQATASDPFQAILGRSSTAFNSAQGYGQQAAGNTQIAGPVLFNPESSYANNIYAGNQQAQNAANIATAQNKASMISAGIGAVGSIGGAMLCWVAREVYGAENPKWLQFRHWMVNHSPVWFFNLYAARGERFAKWISNKPRIKNLVRRWMDGRIATL